MELAGAARDRELVELHLAEVVEGHSDLVLLGTLVGWLAPRSCRHGVVRASSDSDKTKRERVRSPPASMDGGSARPSAARAALRSPPPLLPVSPSPTHPPPPPLSRPSFTPPPPHTHTFPSSLPQILLPRWNRSRGRPVGMPPRLPNAFLQLNLMNLMMTSSAFVRQHLLHARNKRLTRLMRCFFRKSALASWLVGCLDGWLVVWIRIRMRAV